MSISLTHRKSKNPVNCAGNKYGDIETYPIYCRQPTISISPMKFYLSRIIFKVSASMGKHFKYNLINIGFIMQNVAGSGWFPHFKGDEARDTYRSFAVEVFTVPTCRQNP